VNKAFHGILSFDKTKDRAYLEMEAGDCIFFHPMLVHGSGANQSNRYRKAISCHYASSNCDYIDVRGTNQQVISDEIIQMAKSKYGVEVENIAVSTDVLRSI
jgi:phytanoyl-CoA hydroxylase